MERLGSATLAGLVLAAASLPPLYPTVPQASRNDPRLHDALALVDALRAGAAREREMARELFKEMIA
jgi:hypothetical protein